MLVVWRDSVSDTGARHLPLQPVESPAESTLESGGKADRLDSSQMLTSADFGTVFHGWMQPSGDGLPGGYWSRKVPAQKNGRIEQARRLTQMRGVVPVGLYPFFSFPLLVLILFYLSTFICLRGWRVVGGELCHVAGSPGGRGSYSGPVIL